MQRGERVFLDSFYDEFEFELEIFEQIKKMRVKQNLSQRMLARKIGIPQPSLARFESGKILNPKLSFLKKVILGLELELKIVEQKSVL